MSDAPTCYAWDPATAVYLGPLAADPSPLEPGVWLYPQWTCLDAPPSPGAKQWPIRQGSAWTLVPDHRRETWYTTAGIAVVVAFVGDPTAAGLTATAPPPPTPPLPTVTGNQWAFALSDLALASAWRIGVTKSKDSDQVRVGLIARDTPLLASDPLLIRVAANAGTTDGTATGSPIISVPTVFAHAQTMPL